MDEPNLLDIPRFLTANRYRSEDRILHPLGRNINSRRRKALHRLQGGRCHYCDQAIPLKSDTYYQKPARKPNDATIDHKIPQSKGGTDDPDNVVLSCFKCNNIKGHTDYHVFMRQFQVPSMAE